YIHEQNREIGLDVLQFGADQLKPLCLPKDFPAERFGEMTAERWQTLVDQMVEIGSLKADTVKAEEAFTTKFLKSGR
ncbi:MAG TPA: myristoyl transferase, partial [Schlesneria sp.]